MLSGPITQEAGITETSAREEEEGRGREAGTRRQLRGGRKELVVEGGEVCELRCMKIKWKVTELNAQYQT